jgi:hypothetical protein
MANGAGVAKADQKTEASVFDRVRDYFGSCFMRSFDLAKQETCIGGT